MNILIKTYKNNNNRWPIINFKGAPTNKIAKMLGKILLKP